VARALIDKGFTLVRPLAGGLDGWSEAGYPVEADQVQTELVAVRPSGA
jgi:rhodanese-related sulfurtransferase